MFEIGETVHIRFGPIGLMAWGKGQEFANYKGIGKVIRITPHLTVGTNDLNFNNFWPHTRLSRETGFKLFWEITKERQQDKLEIYIEKINNEPLTVKQFLERRRKDD